MIHNFSDVPQNERFVAHPFYPLFRPKQQECAHHMENVRCFGMQKPVLTIWTELLWEIFNCLSVKPLFSQTHGFEADHVPASSTAFHVEGQSKKHFYSHFDSSSGKKAAEPKVIFQQREGSFRLDGAA